MNESEFLDSLLPVISRGWHRTSRFVRSYWRPALLLVLCFLFVWLALESYKQSYRKDLVILTGPAGSTSWRAASGIADTLRQTERIPGVPYRVRVESMDGSDETIERIRGDSEGQIIGFAQSRTEGAEGIKTLLPLDFDYLHILCRTGFLAENFGFPVPHQFDKAFPQLSPGHVFAGPPGGGWRLLAERLFARFGKHPRQLGDYLNPAISDWFQAQAALRSGTLDVVFFTGPLGSTTVQDIADKDKSAVLLGIDDVQTALIEHESFALWPVSFPENAYSAAEWTVDSRGASRASPAAAFLTAVRIPPR